jgi:hypothetical protein
VKRQQWSQCREEKEGEGNQSPTLVRTCSSEILQREQRKGEQVLE